MGPELQLRLVGLGLEEQEAEVRWWNWVHGVQTDPDPPAQEPPAPEQPRPKTPSPRRATRSRSRTPKPVRHPAPRPIQSDDTIREMLIEWINM